MALRNGVSNPLDLLAVSGPDEYIVGAVLSRADEMRADETKHIVEAAAILIGNQVGRVVSESNRQLIRAIAKMLGG